MKKFILLNLIVSILFSCNKDSTTPNQPPINISGLPKAYTQYIAQNHLILYRIFLYDSNNNLAAVSLRQNDTVGGVVQVDSGSYYFTVDPVADLPTGFTSIYKKYTNATAQVETHGLYFNGQKQVIKDSVLTVISGSSQANTKNYSYSANTVLRNTFMQTPSGWNNTVIDSLITNNGNIVYQAQYNNNGSGNWILGSHYSVSNYSTNSNPLYDPGLSHSFGSFLVLEGIEDFLSKNLSTDGGYTWTKDSKGRVVSGAAPDGSYVQYTYQ